MISKEYLILFNAITDAVAKLSDAANLITVAVNLLISAQIDAEEVYIEEGGAGD